MTIQPTNLTVVEAQNILRAFNCMETKSVAVSEKPLIRQALLLLTSLSDYQILGICADTVVQGLLALETYSKALGYQPTLDLASVPGPVYIKFNPKSGLRYLDSYLGNHRGVLVSCQSSQSGSINEMYGHLPLDLFVSAE